MVQCVILKVDCHMMDRFILMEVWTPVHNKREYFPCQHDKLSDIVKAAMKKLLSQDVLH